MIELFQISLICFVFYILGEPGMIFDWYQKLIRDLPELLWKPMGGCLKCWTGQVSFWYFIIKHFGDYNLINHLSFVSAAIMLSIVYHAIYNVLTHLINKYGT